MGCGLCTVGLSLKGEELGIAGSGNQLALSHSGRSLRTVTPDSHSGQSLQTVTGVSKAPELRASECQRAQQNPSCLPQGLVAVTTSSGAVQVDNGD